MTQITLNIPDTVGAHDIKTALQFFVRFAERHPADTEDILLGMHMRETDRESTISLSTFLSGISK